MERPGGVGDDGRGEGEREPLPVVELEGGDHRHRDHGDGQDDRGDQPLPQRGELVRGGTVGVVAGMVVGAVAHGAGGGGGGRSGRGGRVAGGLDGGNEVGDAHVRPERDLGLLGGVVDGGGDPVHAVELLLDPGGARGAGHAADPEFHLGGGGCLGGHLSSSCSLSIGSGSGADTPWGF